MRPPYLYKYEGSRHSVLQGEFGLETGSGILTSSFARIFWSCQWTVNIAGTETTKSSSGLLYLLKGRKSLSNVRTVKIWAAISWRCVFILYFVFRHFYRIYLERDGESDNLRNRPHPYARNARRLVHHGGRYFGTNLWRTRREFFLRRLVWGGWNGQLSQTMGNTFIDSWLENPPLSDQMKFVGQKCRTTIHNHLRWSIEFIHPDSLRSRYRPEHNDRILWAKFRAERGAKADWYQSPRIWRRSRESDRGKANPKNVESAL